MRIIQYIQINFCRGWWEAVMFEKCAKTENYKSWL